MASKGTDVSIYIAEETSPNTLPANPIWHTVRRTSDSLKRTVAVSESDEILDTRQEQGSTADSAEAGGSIEFEFSAQSQDLFFEGVAGNKFTVVDGVDVLEIGGDELATFTIVKHDRKLNYIEILTGARIGELSITGSTEGKITGSITINATSYDDQATVSPVVNPLPATETKVLSSVDVNTFKLNDVNTVGTACAEEFTLTISNNLTGKGCLGSQSLIANRFSEGRVTVTLNTTVALTTTSKQWIPYVISRETMTAQIGLEDKNQNGYIFGFTKLELNNDGMSDTNATDDRTLALELKHIREPMTITRALSMPITQAAAARMDYLANTVLPETLGNL